MPTLKDFNARNRRESLSLFEDESRSHCTVEEAQAYQQTLAAMEQAAQPEKPVGKARAPKEQQEHYAARKARQRVAESTAPV